MPCMGKALNFEARENKRTNNRSIEKASTCHRIMKLQNENAVQHQ